MIEIGISPIHGRGAFTSRNVRKGEAFHTAHLFVFGNEDAANIAETRAAHYVFYIADCDDGSGREITGLALSPISYVNHARPANASFVVDPKTETVTFTALVDISAGEEILIDYGDFAERLGIA
ncbi:SET domain-containing protein-lysine N-methyltransferase [bacterium]|nr:SET domain-containing protein-lysine N-methyltransferase [bacterium]